MEELHVGGVEVSATLHGGGKTLVVLGHGAGGSRRNPMLVALAEALAVSGRAAVLYNFPYAERGLKRPDPPALLERTTQAVADLALTRTGARHLVHGGRSMGGRIASQVVARGAPASGLCFLGYPLHPPGRPDQLRDRHLAVVPVPMLFVQGTRDAFAREDLLDGVIQRLGEKATLHWVENADHSFGVLKRSGRTCADVLAEIRGVVLVWLDRLGL